MKGKCWHSNEGESAGCWVRRMSRPGSDGISLWLDASRWRLIPNVCLVGLLAGDVWLVVCVVGRLNASSRSTIMRYWRVDVEGDVRAEGRSVSTRTTRAIDPMSRVGKVGREV